MPLVITALLATACTGGDEPAAPTATAESSAIADTVYTDGRIYTVNAAQPWATAVAIKDGSFAVVGSVADVEDVTGEGTEVVDLGGRMAMPGLIDTHNHATGPLNPPRIRSTPALPSPDFIDAIEFLILRSEKTANVNLSLPTSKSSFVQGRTWPVTW